MVPTIQVRIIKKKEINGVGTAFIYFANHNLHPPHLQVT